MIKNNTLDNKIFWILRVSCALCFIGHGAWGIITKAGWLPFFYVIGFSEETAWTLMPVIGTMDIALGIWMLFKPTRVCMMYMTIWAIWTALLRPLAGMGWWEFFERAGNYGAPYIFFLLAGGVKVKKDWLSYVSKPDISLYGFGRLETLLKTFTALLLIGHGGFGAFMHKEMLIHHWQSVGLGAGSDPITFIKAIGWFEILLGFGIYIRPTRYLALFIFIWKVFTESLYVIHGPFFWQIWEFIERWGSYGLPLALYVLRTHAVKNT